MNEGMSEFSNPAEELGNTALNETAVQVDMDGQTEPDNRFEDIEKAHAMAIAGDKDRTEAATQRLTAAAITEYADGIAEVPESGRSRRKALAKLDSRFYGQYDYLGSRGASDEDMRKLRNVPYMAGEASREYNDDFTYQFRSRAERADARAERIEEWAAIMHDKPVSPEYKGRHYNVDFAPSSLVKLEDLNAKDQETAARLEKRCTILKEKGYFAAGTLLPTGYDDRLDVDHLLYELEAGEGELSDKHEKLIGDPNTTIGQLGVFHAELIEKAAINPLRNRANITKVVLDDVRSGRASEVAPSETVNA